MTHTEVKTITLADGSVHTVPVTTCPEYKDPHPERLPTTHNRHRSKPRLTNKQQVALLRAASRKSRKRFGGR